MRAANAGPTAAFRRKERIRGRLVSTWEACKNKAPTAGRFPAGDRPFKKKFKKSENCVDTRAEDLRNTVPSEVTTTKNQENLMKENTPLTSRIDGRLAAYAALATAALAAPAIPNADAAVVYSGPVNINVPS